MPEYADITSIAAGHNVALVDMDLITAIVGADQEFLPVRTPGKYRRGQLIIMANGAPDRAGFKSKLFKSGLMTLDQFEYICDTYEGPVTIYSWLNTTTPVRYNAYLNMGDQDDYAEENTIRWGWCLVDVIWTFTKIQVLA